MWCIQMKKMPLEMFEQYAKTEKELRILIVEQGICYKSKWKE